MADLTRPELIGGEFAFLAACQTATIGTANPDETITLCAAMQHAGWRHVIGTLWSVQGLPAVSVTTNFYAGMFEDSQFKARQRGGRTAPHHRSAPARAVRQ